MGWHSTQCMGGVRCFEFNIDLCGRECQLHLLSARGTGGPMTQWLPHVIIRRPWHNYHGLDMIIPTTSKAKRRYSNIFYDIICTARM